MREPKVSEKYTVHYQPIAGGTTNTMCSKVVDKEPDGTTIFRTVSDAKRLQSSIRYEPDGESEQISISERLKDNKHISPIKINGMIRWKNYYEIQIYTAGWRTSTKLGKIKLNIPGIEGITNATKKGTTGFIEFQDKDKLEFTVKYDRRNNTPYISVTEHPMITDVEEIQFDDLDWFHDAYPFSGTSLGVRIGFKTDMKYESTDFEDNTELSDDWKVSRPYDESRSRNQAVRM